MKAGLRNSVRSSIGSALRRSTMTNATAPTTAVDSATMTFGSVKEAAPPSMIPYTRAVIVTAAVIWPGQSRRRVPGARESVSSFAANAIASSETGMGGR